MAKKLISLVNATLIDALVKDEAAINSTTESNVIENHLLDSFLPRNEQARFMSESYLYGDNQGIGPTLKAIFNFNSSGTRGAWSSKYDNFLPIVEFALDEQCYCNTKPSGEEKELPHFRLQLDAICKTLEDLAEKAEEQSIKYYYQNEAKYANDLLKEATEEPHYMHYVNFYKLVVDNWDALKDLSMTYRMLCDLAAMETGWHNRPEARVRLLKLLKDISQEWDN